jgi:ABC-type transporter Mla subunit MlaD
MNFDMKIIVKKISKMEEKLKDKIESGVLLKEAKRFADGQAKSIRQKLKTSKDAKKVLAFIEQRKKQIEKIAADLPGEVKVVRSYIQKQRSELEKIGNDLVKQARAGKINANTLRSAIRQATRKKAATSGKRASTSKKTTKKATSKKSAKRK